MTEREILSCNLLEQVMKRKPEIDVQKDWRVILRGNAYKKMRLKLKGLAQGRCELCGKHCEDGDVHHITLRSGGRRDDRIFVDGERRLQYFCRPCHSGKHVAAKVCPPKPTEQEFDKMLGLVE